MFGNKLFNKYIILAQEELPQWYGEKGKAAINAAEKAVAVGSIQAQDKANFQKFLTTYFKNLNLNTTFLWQFYRGVEDKPYYKNLFPEDMRTGAKDRLEALKLLLQDIDSGLQGIQKTFVEDQIKETQRCLKWLDLQAKVKKLPVTGEIVRKTKEELPQISSKNFTDTAFLKHYTPKYQKMILESIPAIDTALEQGWVARKDLRKWDAIFNKHTKPAPNVTAYNLHRNNNSIYPKEAKIDQVLKDFKPLQDIFARLESLKDEQEQKQLIHKDRSWSPAADKLENKLREIISKIIKDLEEDLYQYHVKEAKKYWDLIQKENLQTYSELSNYKHKEARKYGTKVHIDANIVQLFYADKTTFTKSYPEQKISQWAQAAAKKEAQKTADHFVNKNLHKLAPLLKLKTLKDLRTTQVEIQQGAVHSEMDFLFEDNSKFSVRNKIVYGRSKLGTFFARYPTTFHNVVIEGQPLKGPSEDKIYKEFSGEAAPQEQIEGSFLNKIKTRLSGH